MPANAPTTDDEKSTIAVVRVRKICGGTAQ